MAKSRNPKTSSASSFLRIIGGQYRGRKLPIPNLDGLRPTSDRTRETVFNWLQFDVAERHVLDLFAGTGALGLEALSRGAQSCCFIEPQAQAAQGIQQSLLILGAKQGQVNAGTAEQLLDSNTQLFDLVFIDPPFSLDLWQPALDGLAAASWCPRGALIYVESPKHQAFDVPSCFVPIKDKTSGNVRFQLFEKQI